MTGLQEQRAAFRARVEQLADETVAAGTALVLETSIYVFEKPAL